MNHYIDNDAFQIALKERKRLLVENPELRVSEYLGDCFVKISSNLTHRWNFVGYTFKDEMCLDGIESCLRAVDSYDPDKYTNPFAYFTQCAFWAFVQRIQKEKKQQKIKGRMLLEMMDDEFYNSLDDDEIGIDPSVIEELRNNSFLIEDTPKKSAPKDPGLTAFYED